MLRGSAHLTSDRFFHGRVYSRAEAAGSPMSPTLETDSLSAERAARDVPVLELVTATTEHCHLGRSSTRPTRSPVRLEAISVCVSRGLERSRVPVLTPGILALEADALKRSMGPAMGPDRTET